jgi:hypothetical protein
MKRFQMACGSYPEPVKAQFTMIGPQNEDQLPEGVKLLMAMRGITQVDVRFDFGEGQGERINVFRPIADE